MGRASKKKGSTFERQVCRDLSRWITYGQHDDLFWRSAMSGGRATVRRAKGAAIRQSGDITAVAPEGHVFTAHWFIECKWVRDLSIFAALFSSEGLLYTYWRKAVAEARKYDRAPLLIAKQNRVPTLAIVAETAFRGWTDVQPRLRSHILHCDIYDWEDVLSQPYLGGDDGPGVQRNRSHPAR